MITCAEAVRRFWDYLDDSLSAKERRTVEEHLGFCRECCGELEFAKVLQGALARQTDGDELPEDVRRRMEQLARELQV